MILLTGGGACVVAPGGMHGCLGAVHGCSGGCVHGCSRGACMVFAWGACVVFAGGACVGYDEIRSMSGRYASYWNAFLFYIYLHKTVHLWKPQLLDGSHSRCRTVWMGLNNDGGTFRKKESRSPKNFPNEFVWILGWIYLNSEGTPWLINTIHAVYLEKYNF